MSGAVASPADERTPPALPLDGHQGTDPLIVTAEHRGTAPSNLVSGPLAISMMRMAVPAVASTLLMTVFLSVDTFWIGTQLGPDALAAASTSLFWIWLAVSLAELVSIGATAVGARRHGEGRAGEAARLGGDAVLLALALGGVVGVVGATGARWMLELMHVPPSVSSLGASYLAAYLAGSPLIFGFFAVDAVFRASGDARTPFLLLGTTVAVTLVLDPALVMGWFGLPRLGIVGAAVATVSTRAIAFAIGLTVLVRRRMIRFGGLRPASARAISRVGLPAATTGVVFSLIYVSVTRTATQFGTPALAALGIGHRVESWLYMVGVGCGAAAAAAVGQNLGAGRVDRAERAGWIACGFATGVGIVAATGQLLFASSLARIFSRDVLVVTQAASYLRIASASQLLISAEIVLEGALGGAGETLSPMVTSTAMTALRIPCAAWAAARWGVEGIWWTIVLTAVGRAIAMALLWQNGRWKRRSL